MPGNKGHKRQASNAGAPGDVPAPKASKAKGGKRKAKAASLIDPTLEGGESSTQANNDAPKDEFADGGLPYFYMKDLENALRGECSAPQDSDDEISNDPDGFDAAMANEEEYAARVETLAHDVMTRLQLCEPILVGEVRGKWNIYSPNYLDMYEVADRFSAELRHYGNWKTGTLEIGEEQRDPAIISKELVGVMKLDGFEYDWRIFMNVPEFVVEEARSCPAIKETSMGRKMMKSEIKIGVYFYGNGLMKMKIPGISLGGNEEMGRWVTLYGVREEG